MPPAPPKPRCPRCQFAYAWDGQFCDHCHYPYPSRAGWENFRELERFAASHPDADDKLLIRFAVGCIRRAWHLLTNPDHRNVVKVAEDLVEGRANYNDLAVAANPIGDATFIRGSHLSAQELASALAHEAIRSASTLMWLSGGGRLDDAVFSACRHIRDALAQELVPERRLWEYPLPRELEEYRAALVGHEPAPSQVQALRPEVFRAYTVLSAARREDEKLRATVARAEEAVQCDLYRDVFGYPFAPARVVTPDWRSETVTALADNIYDEKAFDRMPILADALEDAGCKDDEVLSHCRAERVHIRGCWVVELCRSAPA